MREIKFRAWEKENKEMITDFWIDSKDGECFGKYSDEAKPNWILMQYTGLTDKNGKEIYFDDIVKFSFHDHDDPMENYEGTAVIAETMNSGVGLLFDWDNNDAGSNKTFAVIEGGQINDYWDDEDLWDIEVVGNIYENPELITKEEIYKYFTGLN